MFCPKCGTENPETGRFCRSCGTDLGNVSSALSGELRQPQTYIDHKGKVRSKDPSDILSNAIRNSLMGLGFLIISCVLFFTNVAGGRTWWWSMLFPAFSLLAIGVSEFVKYGKMEEKKQANVSQQPTFSNTTQSQQSLPPTQTEYVKPQKSIYETGDLVVPSSVTEGTTHHLEVNKEGETMTLPKK